jgi:virginiamycin B lyase
MSLFVTRHLHRYRVLVLPLMGLLVVMACTSTVPAGLIGQTPLKRGSLPVEITAGPDGALWFTESGADYIGRITTDTQSITEYPIPTPNSQPWGITTGPDKNLWFTELSAGKIGRMTTSGTITEWSIGAGSLPRGITTGPDGALWFVESGQLPNYNAIGRITTA